MLLFASVLMVLWVRSQGLRVSPDQFQFFRWDSVVLDCENPDWILLRTTRWDSGTRCGEGWGEPRELQCFLRYIDPMDSGWYWCESREGQNHGGRNVTVTDQFGPRSETPPPFTETPPPLEYTLALFTKSPAETPSPSERPLAVALLCHLLVLCPYVLATVIMVSIFRHARSGNHEQPRKMMSPTESGMGLNDITVVTTEYCF
ncbi:hypothetical protein NL108_006507 [Boleophthalmus pectinirostris]|uniref:uncharacterized protein LOC110157702 n=1 Tax=Boleophthalmus pectinirostris TaxID=150288 RepID=UPI00242F866D|nr:uncharacterized protein LOC110157702 [Boleophthalmus pectinirostris]KAJ0055637.1 hypothetical protein NL108_006507 [Boleophthalmus pectinirostris]